MLTDHRHTPATGRIQSFLDSQRGLVSFYAAEGKQFTAAWSDLGSGDPRPQSPMLIPRATAAMEGEPCATTHITPSEKHEAPPRQSLHSTTEPLLNPKLSNSKIAPSRQIESRNSGRTQLRPVDQDLTPNEESEHSKRLAQRRNRRRARRAAMDAADEDAISETAASQGDVGQSKKKRQKVMPKSKKAKVAPALLLMQTFSGQNMGKSRLTIKPSTSVGVFNKGKASAKVQTKSQRAGRLGPGIVFSESAFLNKTRPVHSEDDTSVDDSDDSAAHSAHSIMERTSNRKVEIISQPPNNRSSRERAPMDHDDTGGNALSLSGSVREASPPWAVEEQAPSNDPEITFTHPRSSAPPPPPKPKTAVIGVNQYAWSSKLRKPETHIVTPPGVPLLPLPPKSPDEKRQTTSSYFRATRVSVEPPVLSPPPYGETDPIAGATRDGTVRPSPRPHIDDLGSSENIALSLSDMSNDYTGTPHVPISACHSPANSMEFPLNEGYLEADFIDADSGYGEWRLEVPNHHELPSFNYHEQGGQMLLLDTDQGPLDRDEIGSECDFLLDEPYGPYDEQEGAEYETHGYYGYEDGPSYPPASEDFGREEFSEGVYAEHEEGVEYGLGEVLNDTGIDELGICWAAAEEDDGLDPLPDELELENPALIGEDDDAVLEDSAEEPAPSLVRIITEASLESDLMKSISNHWGTAHRLY